MSLSEMLSRVRVSSRSSTIDASESLSNTLPAENAEQTERTTPAYDVPPPHEELDLPPSYPLSFSDAYKQWISSSEARQALLEIEKEYKERESEVAEMKKELRVMKERSAEHFARLHDNKKKRSISQFIKNQATKRKRSSDESASDPTPTLTSNTSFHSTKISTTTATILDAPPGVLQPSAVCQESREALQLAFEASHAAEMEQNTRVTEAQLRADELKIRNDATAALASSEEETWLHLKHVAEGRPPTTSTLATRLGAALEDLNTAETAFGLIQRERFNLTRARLTVQHAHRYFTQSLKICDDLHGGPPEPSPQIESPSHANGQVRRGMGKLDLSVKLPKIGNGVFGRFGATTKVLDYQNAVRLASMAQACLNECIRVLEPYAESIPEGELREDFDAIKRDGVLQIVQVYNLVFGGRIINSGVEQAIGKMLKQQEVSFARLTRLAVWVQKRVPECEEAERDGVRDRFATRKELADVWKEEFRVHS